VPERDLKQIGYQTIVREAIASPLFSTLSYVRIADRDTMIGNSCL
jgi:hypothetical protein